MKKPLYAGIASDYICHCMDVSMSSLLANTFSMTGPDDRPIVGATMRQLGHSLANGVWASLMLMACALGFAEP